MGQEKLSNLAILSIEHVLASSISLDTVFDEFAKTKARKISFK